MAGFMVLQVWREGGVENPDGEIYPASSANENDTPLLGQRWWAQYSAPGYMDQTTPVYAESAVDAAKVCFDLFGDWESPEERSEYASVLWECRKLDRQERAK